MSGCLPKIKYMQMKTAMYVLYVNCTMYTSFDKKKLIEEIELNCLGNFLESKIFFL